MGLRTAICPAFLRTPIGRRMGELLPLTMFEIRQIVAHASSVDAYAGVTAEVLLAHGGSGPAYFTEHHQKLARVIPRSRTLTVPRARHDALAVAPAHLVGTIADFFTAPLASHPTASA